MGRLAQGEKTGKSAQRECWREVPNDTTHPVLTERSLHNLPYANPTGDPNQSIQTLVHITPWPQALTPTGQH